MADTHGTHAEHLDALVAAALTGEGLDHPGATYNPWEDATWCLCGGVVRLGDHASHVACCDGPLVQPCHIEGTGHACTHPTTEEIR